MRKVKANRSDNQVTDVLNRRQVLKKLGFGSLAVIGSGSLVTSLQGCSTLAEGGAEGSLLSSGEITNLEKICEAILPRTQTPGAIDAGVAEHLSSALAISYRQREAEYFRKGMAVFVDNFVQDTGTLLSEADTSKVTERLNAYLQRYHDDPSVLEKFDQDFIQNRAVNDDFHETYFITNVIDATVWSYFTSELVGESVMRYDPIPGSYEACIAYVPGEHSWSG